MSKRYSFGRRSYGKVRDYSEVLRKQRLRREIILWTVEIVGVIIVAFLIAYYLL